MTAARGRGQLDFVCIGAQKAGTTALWRYLASHPELVLPADKAATFFAVNSRYEKGLAWFFSEFFGGADPAAKWGKVSPRYMGEGFQSEAAAVRESVPVAEVARRLSSAFPQVKLIALLRDPVDRAVSNYRMEVRRGFEVRSFDEAIREQLRPDALRTARRSTTLTGGYVVQGEYGRILTDYLQHFPPEQLRIVLSEDLERDPERVMTSLFRYLGVDPGHRPADLGTRYFRGGVRNRVPKEAEVELRRYLAEHVWPLLGPDAETHRRAFYVWLEAWRVKPDDSPVAMSDETRRRLAEHFRSDARILRERLEADVPWT